MAAWSDEATEKLKADWAEGLSASEIGGRVGKTRNAVIGKVHRLGLSGRATTERKPTKPRRVPGSPRKRVLTPKPRRESPWRQFVKALQEAPPAPIVEAPVPLNQRRTMTTIEADECRWPIGDPQDADFHFCGAKKMAGIPYCECHGRRAFRSSDAQEPKENLLKRSSLTGLVVPSRILSFEDA